MEDFNEICFKFQQEIVDIFNKEQNIPFLLKYYLIKDIWDNITTTKMKNDMEIRSRYISKPQVVSEIKLKEDEKDIKTENKEDLTN